MDELRAGYIEGFGIFGNFVMFFWCRAVPILLIYFTTVIFIFFQTFQPSQWSIELLFVALTSGDSHIIVYSAILLMILRINLHPRITIPFFITAIVAYILFDTYIVSLVHTGVLASLAKMLKYFIVFFALTIEFFFAKRLIVKSVLISIAMTISLFIIIVSLYFIIFFASSDGSRAKDRSANYLLRIGFNTPLDYMKTMAIKKRSTKYIATYLNYHSFYKSKKILSDDDLKILFFGADLSSGNNLIGGVILKRPVISYNDFDRWIKSRLIKKQHLAYLKHLTKYGAQLVRDQRSVHFGSLKGNKFYILWRMDVIKESKSIKEISKVEPYLSHIDVDLSQKSYDVIRYILNVDYALKMNFPSNHPLVIDEIRKKISFLRKKGIVD